jgi:hypothetical protein
VTQDTFDADLRQLEEAAEFLRAVAQPYIQHEAQIGVYWGTLARRWIGLSERLDALTVLPVAQRAEVRDKIREHAMGARLVVDKAKALILTPERLERLLRPLNAASL